MKITLIVQTTSILGKVLPHNYWKDISILESRTTTHQKITFYLEEHRVLTGNQDGFVKSELSKTVSIYFCERICALQSKRKKSLFIF